ncbi:MAG: zf-HC2 domain-containing protein [Bryobacterales bacterium]|nr:zf-HC2 domain-containing protein [Bryobacterales bacterium]
MTKRTTLDCREVFAALSDYLDKELPDEDCEQMRRHIEDCAPCVEFVESLRKSRDLCKGFASPEQAAPLDTERRDELRAAFQAFLADRR